MYIRWRKNGFKWHILLLFMMYEFTLKDKLLQNLFHNVSKTQKKPLVLFCMIRRGVFFFILYIMVFETSKIDRSQSKILWRPQMLLPCVIMLHDIKRSAVCTEVTVKDIEKRVCIIYILIKFYAIDRKVFVLWHHFQLLFITPHEYTTTFLWKLYW